MGLHFHLHGRNSCQPDLQGDDAPASQLPAQTQAPELKIHKLLRDPPEPEGTGLKEAPGSFPAIAAAAEKLRLIEEVPFLFSLPAQPAVQTEATGLHQAPLGPSSLPALWEPWSSCEGLDLWIRVWMGVDVGEPELTARNQASLLW